MYGREYVPKQQPLPISYAQPSPKQIGQYQMIDDKLARHIATGRIVELAVVDTYSTESLIAYASPFCKFRCLYCQQLLEVFSVNNDQVVYVYAYDSYEPFQYATRQLIAQYQMLVNEMSEAQLDVSMSVQQPRIQDGALFIVGIGQQYPNDISEVLNTGQITARDMAEESRRLIHQVLKVKDDLKFQQHNKRLMRIATKLSMICDRDQLNGDAQWSSTGDRYTLSLVRDYIYHQQDAGGKPVLNMNHVTKCLDSIDRGSSDQILLMSRDERNCIVVTFEEVKRCLESSFQEMQ